MCHGRLLSGWSRKPRVSSNWLLPTQIKVFTQQGCDTMSNFFFLCICRDMQSCAIILTGPQCCTVGGSRYNSLGSTGAAKKFHAGCKDLEKRVQISAARVELFFCGPCAAERVITRPRRPWCHRKSAGSTLYTHKLLLSSSAPCAIFVRSSPHRKKEQKKNHYLLFWTQKQIQAPRITSSCHQADAWCWSFLKMVSDNVWGQIARRQSQKHTSSFVCLIELEAALFIWTQKLP